MKDKILIFYYAINMINTFIDKYKDSEFSDKFILICTKYINIIQNNKEIIFIYDNKIIDLTNVKFAYFCNTTRNQFFLTKVLETFGIKCIPSFNTIQITSNKMLQQLCFKANNVPFIDSYYLKSTNLKEFFVNNHIDKFVEKPLSGSLGNGIKLYDTNTISDGIISCPSKFYQKEIKTITPKYDLRLIVTNINNNPKFICAEKRICKFEEIDFRTNLSQGNIGEDYSPTKEEIDLAIKAIQSIPEMIIGGVDIIKDIDGNYYVLEINSCPGNKIIKIAGINFQEQFIDNLLLE